MPAPDGYSPDSKLEFCRRIGRSDLAEVLKPAEKPPEPGARKHRG